MRHSILGLVLFLGGCAATRSLAYDDAPVLAPTCPRAVRLYAHEEAIGAPYTALAVLHAEGNFGGDSTLLRSLRSRAAALGATGLVYDPVDLGAQTVDGRAIYVPSDTTRIAQECTPAERLAAAADTASATGSPLPR